MAKGGTAALDSEQVFESEGQLRDACIKVGFAYIKYREIAEQKGVTPESLCSVSQYKARKAALSQTERSADAAEFDGVASNGSGSHLPDDASLNADGGEELTGGRPSLEEVLAAAQSKPPTVKQAVEEFKGSMDLTVIETPTALILDTWNRTADTVRIIVNNLPNMSNEELYAAAQETRRLNQAAFVIEGAISNEILKRIDRIRGGPGVSDVDGKGIGPATEEIAANFGRDPKTVRENTRIYQVFFEGKNEDIIHRESSMIPRDMYRAALALAENDENGNRNWDKCRSAIDMAERKLSSLGSVKYTVDQFRNDVAEIKGGEESAEDGNLDTIIWYKLQITPGVKEGIELLVRDYIEKNAAKNPDPKKVASELFSAWVKTRVKKLFNMDLE